MKFLTKILREQKLPSRLKKLYIHRVIRDAGFGLVSIFSIIFLYELTGSFYFVLYIWLVVSGLYFFVMPWLAKLLKYFSMNVLLIWGTVFLAVQNMALYFLAEKNYIIWSVLVFFVAFNVVYRFFYWIPYHVDLAHFIDKNHKARRLSSLSILVSLVGVILPILSAWLIEKFDFSALFVFSTIIILLSIVPVLFFPRTSESYSFGYFQTFKKLFLKKHAKTNLAYFADGFQGGIGILVWPIFIFLLLKGDYLNVGLLSAAIIFVSCVVRYFVGEFTDRFDRKKVLKIGSILYGLGWVLKAVSGTAFQLFMVGSFHDFSGILIRTPFDALTYDIAADEGHYVDEFTILREMSLHLGRVVMILLALLIMSFLNLVWIFVVGGLISLFLNLVSKEEFVY